MPVEVILPKVDMDMATGRISKWFFGNETAVKKGDVLFEIETDKAAMEIDAPASGILRDITGGEGVDIPVGSAVAWIYEEGEAYAGAPAAQTAVVAAIPDTATGAVTVVSQPSQVAAGAAEVGKVRATPLARRLASDSGIDLSAVIGSGPHGRVTRADVVGHRPAENRSSTAGSAICASAKPGSSAPSDEQVRKLFAEGSYELVAHSNMRRTIARRLVEAKSTVPHFYVTLDCNIDALLKLRAELNASAPIVDGKADFKLSVNDMVIRAYALALRAVPDANVSWTDEGLLKHRNADIGVAVSVPGGLITPIVRNAQIKSLSAISAEMKDLGARARDGKLKTDEYQGGTAAISNLGMFGVREFAAIVNPPHATILAVGAGERRPVVSGDNVTVSTVMTVTLSTDHRAVDGALAAELLGTFRSYIERPMLMLV
ncbi:pyruvate dehydrogenase complex dihydrolipoamide acetyltransferase [Shinella sp. AETb1-6]|uniref:2-oxo acid dehydrogenase subunit E2 n=1 Tax=Shinella sp. AETb1-6 TaxID=2692210 RepID=UPI001369B309|nr:2-oxo acid dehydrogenase subunit E2 [Shinella sp. AETb1-6]MXN54324.1 pyruvate dehydrogenase complex dihydrolipoamide acetyltransferase [Shinella sp. AETb1-6]